MLCLIANVNRDPKKRPFRPEEFNPYRKPRSRDRKRGVPLNAKTVLALKRYLPQGTTTE